jgi:fermentation-respiration switch protein FrsA (DUF1100 family)
MRTTILLAVLAGALYAGTPSARAEDAPAAVVGSEVSIEGPGYALPATLELPATATPVPCVVFLAGSGPTDRDWNSDMFPQSGRNGSARQLAEALREAGVGSVRYDKVASGANTSPHALLSLQHYVDEGLAAYRLLREQEACGPVFLVGNSEGCVHALGVAAVQQEEPDFGGVVTLSGPGRTMLDTMIDQIRQQARGTEYTEAQVEAGLEALRAGVHGLPATVADPPDFSSMPDLAVFWQSFVASGDPHLLQDLMTVDPLALASAYRGPILVVSATQDLQIPMSDGDALFSATPDVGQVRRRVTIEEANHVYKHETRSRGDTDDVTLMMAYWEKGRPLAPGTIDNIVSFIGEVAAGKL